jgi:hypothetical protein
LEGGGWEGKVGPLFFLRKEVRARANLQFINRNDEDIEYIRSGLILIYLGNILKAFIGHQKASRDGVQIRVIPQ